MGKQSSSVAWAIALLCGGVCMACAAPIRQSTSPLPVSPRPEVPLVVATNSVLCDLTRKIAAETIDLTCLIQPGTDTHVYQPTPDDRKAIEDAKLILYAGYNLEPSLTRLIQASSNPAPKIAVDEVAVPQPLKGGHEHESGEESGHHAEEAPSGQVPDPHVFHSAANGARMAEVIEDNLVKLEPANTQLYRQNAEQIVSQLEQINTWIKTQIATIPAPRRKLVTTHDAFGYYAKTYGIPVEGALQGISTEEQPTAARVAELSQLIKQSGVPTIFAEVTINPKLNEAVAKEAQVQVSPQALFGDGLGAPNTPANTYPKMLIANTQAIVQGLGGKFTPF